MKELDAKGRVGELVYNAHDEWLKVRPKTKIYESVGEVVGHRILAGRTDVHYPKITRRIADFEKIIGLQRDSGLDSAPSGQNPFKSQVHPAVGRGIKGLGIFKRQSKGESARNVGH